MTIIDVMKCKDGIVIISENEATIFKGYWFINDFNDKSVEEIKNYRRCSPTERKKIERELNNG